MSKFYVIRQKRKPVIHSNDKEVWTTICFYDENDHYRGPAYFEDRASAEAYMKIYQDKIEQRNERNINNGRAQHMKLSLRIYEEEKIP